MSKLIRENKGKKVLIFLQDNNFRFEGKILNFDEKYLEILDSKTNNFKIILIENIKEIEVLKND